MGEEAAQELKLRFSRGKVCLLCVEPLQVFAARCALGLDSHPLVRTLLLASCIQRTVDTCEKGNLGLMEHTLTMADGKGVVIPSLLLDAVTMETLGVNPAPVSSGRSSKAARSTSPPVIPAPSSSSSQATCSTSTPALAENYRVFFPLSTYKRSCNPHWSSDTRWQAMREMTRDCTLFEQVVIVRRMMLLPFGTKPPFRRPRTSDEDVELLRDIFDSSKRTPLQSANKLWRYLSSADPTEELSTDTGFLASFAARFLIDECAGPWDAFSTFVLKLAWEKCWTTSWGPVALINLIFCEKEGVLIRLSRQAPKPLGREVHGANAHNLKLERGKETQRRQATVACIILFHSALGKEMLKLLRSFAPFRETLMVSMAVSFLLCELRKQADTGSTKFRDYWGAARRAELAELTEHTLPHLHAIRVALRHRGDSWGAFCQRP